MINVVADDKTDTVTFTLDATYSSYWFTYNELSQISPLPVAWDVTSPKAAPGSGGCSAASYASVKTSFNSKGLLVDDSASAKACAAVYDFLTGKNEAGDLGTYASNPLWTVVDGPFKLTQYDATDNGATLVPNARYSGPVKSSLDKLVLLPFTSDASEFGVLQDGSTINIGYVPPENLPRYDGAAFSKAGSPLAGRNNASLASKYNLGARLPLGRQLLRPQLHQPGLGADLQAALRPPGDAVADEPEPVDPALQRRLRCPHLRPGAGAAAHQARHEAGELEPVPVQPHARQVPFELSRLEGRA